MASAFRELDTVVLMHDIPDRGLHAGDLGAVVMVYSANIYEVEFVNASGDTPALCTLSANDVRAVRDDDLAAGR